MTRSQKSGPFLPTFSVGHQMAFSGSLNITKHDPTSGSLFLQFPLPKTTFLSRRWRGYSLFLFQEAALPKTALPLPAILLSWFIYLHNTYHYLTL